jgi:hypothetical protein
MSLQSLNAELTRFQRSRRRATVPTRTRRGNGTGYPPPSARTASRRVRAFDAISYRVPGIIPPLRQPTSMLCWATVTTILVSWKEQVSIGIRDVIARYGEPYLGYVDNNQALPASQNTDFYTRVGMILEPPQSFSFEGWLSLLRVYGPLIVWVHPPSNPQNLMHLMVLVGMEGDGTESGTNFRLIDPGSGSEVTYNTQQFIRRYEEVLGPFPPGSDLIWQVIHWPPNAQSTSQSISRMASRSGFSSSASRSYSRGSSIRARAFNAALAWGARVSEAFRTRIREIAQNLSCDANHLMAAMAFETGESFSPSVRNRSSGATGLIQFMPSTARTLGTTTDELAGMTAERQLDYVERYFTPYRGRVGTLEDVYMAILWPRAVGQANDFVLFSDPSRAYQLNRGLDGNRDGRVTKAEASSPVQNKLTRGLTPEMAG